MKTEPSNTRKARRPAKALPPMTKPAASGPASSWCRSGMASPTISKKRAQMLAELGYNVFVADIYGKGVRPTTPGSLLPRNDESIATNRPLLRARARAGARRAAQAAEHRHQQLAAIGYCFGGTTVLELARDGADLKGVVSFHGELDTPNPADAKNIKGQVLVLHGADDPLVPDAKCWRSRRKCATPRSTGSSCPTAMPCTPSPTGTFRQGTPGPAAYNKKADQRSWVAMQEFFEGSAAADGGRLGAHDSHRSGSGHGRRPRDRRRRADWEPLWQGYLTFYEATLPPTPSTVTWARLHDPGEPMFVLGAYVDGRLVGHRALSLSPLVLDGRQLLLPAGLVRRGRMRAAAASAGKLIAAVEAGGAQGRRQPGLLADPGNQRHRAHPLRQGGGAVRFHSVSQDFLDAMTEFGSASMTSALAYSAPSAPRTDFFLGVEQSATGRAWRDRLDDRGRALAAAIAQRHGLPDLLAAHHRRARHRAR